MSAFEPHDIWLITGPTASGKSSLALSLLQILAPDYQGVIINADAMQMYRELPILTAQPSPADQKCVPHRLYSILSARQKSTMVAWATQACQEIEKAHAQGKTPFLVGGTGLYLKALLTGFSNIPKTEDGLVKTLEQDWQVDAGQKLYRQLEDCDPVLAKKLAPNDRQRIIRAVAVFLQTGVNLSTWQAEKAFSPPPKWRFHLIALMPDRQQLACYARRRLDMMLAQGCLEEIAAFCREPFSDPSLGSPIARAHGVREFSAYLRGEIDLQAAKAETCRQMHSYTKRQLTWIRNQFLPLFPQYAQLANLYTHRKCCDEEVIAACKAYL